jgi:DNA-directed RNA polymerase specialized sigma subunit
MISLFAVRLWRSGRRFAGGYNWAKAARLERSYSPMMDESTGLSTLADSLAAHRRFQPEEIARVNVDYGVAQGRMNARERELWAALVVDHERGSQIRIAAEMKLCEARVTQLKGQIAAKLQKIGYEPGK